HRSYLLLHNPTSTTQLYTLSLHDALPISHPPTLQNLEPASARSAHLTSRCDRNSRWLLLRGGEGKARGTVEQPLQRCRVLSQVIDRKSTRLNSSHDQISYAVFCLKKKKKT